MVNVSSFEKHSSNQVSVNTAHLSLQFWRAFAIGQYDRIVAPCGLQIGLDLFLPRARPRCVVTLRDSDAAVPEEYRNSVEGYASEKQLDGERIPESVGMTCRHLRQFKEPLKPALPFSFGASHG